MTDRVHSLLVTLNADTRDDDVEALREAILLFVGVIDVSLNVTDHVKHAAYQQALEELRNKMRDVLYG